MHDSIAFGGANTLSKPKKRRSDYLILKDLVTKCNALIEKNGFVARPAKDREGYQRIYIERRPGKWTPLSPCRRKRVETCVRAFVGEWGDSLILVYTSTGEKLTF